MDTSIPIKKKTFKDKIKDRVSLVKQKSSDTHLNARSNVGPEKHGENIDFRQCVESLLPQLHHENEIKKALLENMVELRIKEASHAKREQRKIQDDFFLLVSKQVEEKNQPKTKKKSKVSTSPSVDEVMSLQKEDGNTGSTLILPSKTALNYFDTELNDHNMVTPLIISKYKLDINADSLFWDGQEKPIANVRSRNKLEEGFFVGSKPKSRSNHLRGILSQSEDQSEWFGSDCELIMEDNPVREVNAEIKYIPVKEVELLTDYVKPIFFKGVIKKSSPLDADNEFSQSIIEFDFSTLKFSHHPLFSVEHVIAQKVIWAYDVYVKKQSEKVLKQQDDLLSSLRRTKASIEQKLLSVNDNGLKKLYKDQNLRKHIKEISKIRKSRFKEALNQKNLEKEILKLWRNIKYIRRQLKYTSTNLVLEISKIQVDIEEDRQYWEDNFEMEVNDIIAELKCEYFELKMDYIRKTKISKGGPDTSSEKSQKPHLEYDEVKIRKNLFNEMCDAFRQPGEPIISFKLSRSPAIITKIPNSLAEMNRRADVDKTKLFIKIFINNKEICKTKIISLNYDFEQNIDESFSIHLPKEAVNIKFVVLEQTSFLPPTLIGEILVAIPKKHILLTDVKMEDYSFIMRNKRNYNHNGVGSCNTLSELLKAKYSQLIVHNIDLQEQMICQGSVSVKIGWTTSSEGIYNFTPPITNIPNKEISSSEILPKLINTLLDPNDPKNIFLFKYLQNLKDKPESSEKFYLNFFFDFDFIQMRNSESFIDTKLENKTDIKDILANNLQIITNEEANTSSASRPRGSVLDDSSILNKILDPVDLQRRTSIRYLQLVYEHLSLQSEVDNKDKQLSDIVTVFHYPGLRTITINFLRPKRPLFYQTRQPNITLKSHKVDTARNYVLKICILKAFQLPCRSEGTQVGTSTDTEEGGLKMMSLKPFVRVTCQGRSLRTSTAVGNNPTWNEQLCFPVRYDSSSIISFHLFDEIFEDLLTDDRLENTTVHCQYSANWLGSMKISLPNVFSQAKIEGTLLMHSPLEMLGYKQNLEEKYAHSHISYDSLRRDVNLKQREGFNISMLLEVFPTYSDTTLPIEILETNEMDYMIKYLNSFTESYKTAFPNRILHLLVLDTSGKYICITRLFKALQLPEFGDNVFANLSHYEESMSSKNSTPNRKKSSKNQNSDDLGTRSTKSVMSTNVGEGSRPSKSNKDAFEMKSLDGNVTENAEKNLFHRLQICTRFVAMIPLFELNNLGAHYVALSGYQTLRLVCGSMMDHTILLMNYFMQLGVDCWYLSGHALPRGLSTYVLVKENKHTNDIGMKEGLKSYARLSSSMNTKNVWKYYIYDATTGIKYDTKDPFCPLQKVYSVCNNENIWANIQVVERCNLTKFDFNVTSEWRPVFQKDHLISCPGPLPGLSGTEESLYSYGMQDVQRLRDVVEDKLKNKIQRWRGHRRTTWNRHCSGILKNTLVQWEKWSLNQSSPKPKNSHRLQQLLLSYQVYGFPYNTTYTSMGDIISAIKATQTHLNENTSTEFALGVEIFPYPNCIYSVWIYLASITKK